MSVNIRADAARVVRIVTTQISRQMARRAKRAAH